MGEGCGQGGQAHFVDADGAGQGVSFQLGHQGALADDDAGLGAAEEFVAGEKDQADAGGDAFLGHRFVGQAVFFGGQEGAAADIVEDGDAVLRAEGRQFGLGNGGGEALNAEVAGVGLEEGGGAVGDGIGVVAGVGAVGGADIHQGAAALSQHIGDAEAAADFHRLAAGYYHFAAGGEGGEAEEQGGGVVVDDQGSFSAGNLPEQGLEVRLAGAAPSGGQVDFQVGVALRGGAGGVHCGPAQGGAAQVGMDDDAGGIDDRSGRRRNQGVHGGADGGGDGVGIGCGGAGADAGAGVGDGIAGQCYYPLAAVSGDGVGEGIAAYDALDAGQAAEGGLVCGRHC